MLMFTMKTVGYHNDTAGENHGRVWGTLLKTISHHLSHPRHPGKGAASALPINTLLAPPFPEGSFGAGLFAAELLAFSFG